MPVGLPPPEVMVQEPRSEPPTVYLKTLSVRAVVEDPDAGAVGHQVGGAGVAAVQVEAAGGVLAAGEASGGAGVAIDLVALGIDDPDIGAVGGDALHVGIAGQRAGGPGAEEAAAGVIDIDVLVGIDDPDFVAGCGAGGTAGGGVAAVDRVVFDGRAARAVFKRLVRGAVIDDVELGWRQVVVDDRADALAIGDRRADGIGEVDGEGFVAFVGRVVERRDENGLCRLSGSECDRSRRGRIVAAREGSAVGRRIIDCDRRGPGRREIDAKDGVGQSAEAENFREASDQ